CTSRSFASESPFPAMVLVRGVAVSKGGRSAPPPDRPALVEDHDRALRRRRFRLEPGRPVAISVEAGHPQASLVFVDQRQMVIFGEARATEVGRDWPRPVKIMPAAHSVGPKMPGQNGA